MGIVERAAPAESCRINVIGGFSVQLGDAAIDLRNRKAQAILAYLALSSPHTQARERLAYALWSDKAGEQARQSLRQTLLDIRKALGRGAEELLDVRRDAVALRQRTFAIDIVSLIEAIEAGAPPDPSVDWGAMGEAVLPGFEDVDTVFGEWLVGRRAALYARLAEAMEARLGDPDEELARGWAQALSHFDPAHEPACRRLMEADAARGDVRAALRRYDTLWDLLDADYATEPSPETQALAVRLKSLDVGPPKPVPSRPALTLSMGEFRLDGVAEHLGYLVRGFRQDLIASLTPYREWVVIEPGAGVEPPRADGVYEIEGVAFPSREGVRLNVTLKETAAGRFVWGQQDVDLSLGSWFETCRVTTRRIAAALDVRISGDRLAQRAQVADVSLPLYDKLLKARDYLARWTPEADQRAELIFRDILRVDPSFVRAMLGIVDMINSAHIVFPGVRRPKAGETDAVRLARAAVDADPLDAHAQLCLGWSLAMAGRAEEAVGALVAACEANPNDPRRIASAADALANCGAIEAAVEKASASLDLDLGASRLNWGYRVAVHLHAGDLERAVEAARRSDNAIPLGGGYETAALARLGRMSEARAAWETYTGWLRSRWRGAADPDERAMLDWFLDAPPITDPAIRDALAETMRCVVTR